MNHLKCVFRITFENTLGFMVRHHGIKIDPSKIKSILEIPPPICLTQFTSLQDILEYIRRFITNLSVLSAQCNPISTTKYHTPNNNFMDF